MPLNNGLVIASIIAAVLLGIIVVTSYRGNNSKLFDRPPDKRLDLQQVFTQYVTRANNLVSNLVHNSENDTTRSPGTKVDRLIAERRLGEASDDMLSILEQYLSSAQVALINSKFGVYNRSLVHNSRHNDTDLDDAFTSAGIDSDGFFQYISKMMRTQINLYGKVDDPTSFQKVANNDDAVYEKALIYADSISRKF